MQIIDRYVGEQVQIGDNIKVTIVAVNGSKVRIGFDAPKEVSILRDDFKKPKPATRDPNELATMVVSHPFQNPGDYTGICKACGEYRTHANHPKQK